MLKKTSSFVLASLRGSTYHRARAAGAAQGGRVRKFTPQSLGHWALTNSRPCADVTILIRRVADLAVALLDSLLNILRIMLSRSVTTSGRTSASVKKCFSIACQQLHHRESDHG
jgi:hypothetical protein